MPIMPGQPPMPPPQGQPPQGGPPPQGGMMGAGGPHMHPVPGPEGQPVPSGPPMPMPPGGAGGPPDLSNLDLMGGMQGGSMGGMQRPDPRRQAALGQLRQAMVQGLRRGGGGGMPQA